MSFNGLLQADFAGPKRWILSEPLTYTVTLDKSKCKNIVCGDNIKLDGNTVTITAPEGYVTDLATIPRLLWSMIAPWDMARPAVIHDVLCDSVNKKRGLTPTEYRVLRATGDFIFLRGMGEVSPSIPKWKMYSCYIAVLIYGKVLSFKRFFS